MSSPRNNADQIVSSNTPVESQPFRFTHELVKALEFFDPAISKEQFKKDYGMVDINGIDVKRFGLVSPTIIQLPDEDDLTYVNRLKTYQTQLDELAAQIKELWVRVYVCKVSVRGVQKDYSKMEDRSSKTNEDNDKKLTQINTKLTQIENEVRAAQQKLAQEMLEVKDAILKKSDDVRDDTKMSVAARCKKLYIEHVTRFANEEPKADYSALNYELSATEQQINAICSVDTNSGMYQMSQHLTGLIDWHHQQIATRNLEIRHKQNPWGKIKDKDKNALMVHVTQKRVCEESLVQLRVLQPVLGKMNAFLFFDQDAALKNDPNNHLMYLAQCFSKNHENPTTLDALIVSQVKALRVKPAPVNDIARFFKTKAAKDTMFAETQLALHLVLQNKEWSFTQKETRMRNIIAQAKGNDTRLFGTSARYAQLAYEARLLCYLQGFQQGEIPLMKMVLLLDTLKQQVPDSLRAELNTLVSKLKNKVTSFDTTPFVQRIEKSLQKYADLAAKDPAKEASLPKKVRTILKSYASTQSASTNGLFNQRKTNGAVVQPEALPPLRDTNELNKKLYKVKKAIISRNKAYRKW